MNRERPMVTVYLLGKKCTVPADLTIMQAMEYAGFRLVRGCGCRSGFCGACAVWYRIGTTGKMQTALACQMKVEADMRVGRIESFPVEKKSYDINRLPASENVVGDIYPEIFDCIHCNACTKSCPQHLPVLKYIIQAQKGDFAGCAKTSFGCVSCHLCSSRCPVGISHSEVSILARRVIASQAVAAHHDLADRVTAVHQGAYDAAMATLMSMDNEDLHKRYDARDIE